MHELIDFLAQTEVMIILTILGVVLVIYFILWFRSFLKNHEQKKKLRNNTMELTNLAKDVKLELAKTRIDIKKEEPSIITEVEKEIVTPKKIEKKKEEKVIPVKKEVIEPRNEIVVKEVFTSPIESIPVETIVVNNDKTAVDDMVLSKMYDSPVEVLDVKKDEDITYKEEVYTKEEAKKELDRITMELAKEEINKPLQVEVKEENTPISFETVEEKVDTNIDLTPFEDDQEENAIISLEELLLKGKVITQDEIIKYEDEGNEPISISELEARYKKEKELEQEATPMVVTPTVPVQNMTLQDFNEVKVTTYKEDKSYNPTPVISPIFGIEEGNIAKEDALELENTANFDKLDEEIRKTNEFLSKIRELQRKLD